MHGSAENRSSSESPALEQNSKIEAAGGQGTLKCGRQGMNFDARHRRNSLNLFNRADDVEFHSLILTENPDGDKAS